MKSKTKALVFFGWRRAYPKERQGLEMKNEVSKGEWSLVAEQRDRRMRETIMPLSLAYIILWH